MSLTEDRQQAVIIAAIMWGALLSGLLMVLVYMHCQQTDDRIMECVKLGRSLVECKNSFQQSK